jgi:Sec-independent protein translocase protein TatA
MVDIGGFNDLCTLGVVLFDGAFSPVHWLIIGVVVLLVVRPEELPKLAGQVGRGVRVLRRVQHLLRAELGDLVGDFHDATSATTPGDQTGDGPSQNNPVESPAPGSIDSDTERGQRIWSPRPEPNGQGSQSGGVASAEDRVDHRIREAEPNAHPDPLSHRLTEPASPEAR